MLNCRRVTNKTKKHSNFQRKSIRSNFDSTEPENASIGGVRVKSKLVRAWLKKYGRNKKNLDQIKRNVKFRS